MKLSNILLIAVFVGYGVDMIFYAAAPKEVRESHLFYKWPLGGGVAAYLKRECPER